MCCCARLSRLLIMLLVRLLTNSPRMIIGPMPIRAFWVIYCSDLWAVQTKVPLKEYNIRYIPSHDITTCARIETVRRQFQVSLLPSVRANQTSLSTRNHFTYVLQMIDMRTSNTWPHVNECSSYAETFSINCTLKVQNEEDHWTNCVTESILR